MLFDARLCLGPLPSFFSVHQTLALQLEPEPEVPNLWREGQVLSVDESFLSLHTVSESQEISLDEGFFVCSFFVLASLAKKQKI